MYQVRKVRERAHEADGEPVANRLPDPGLRFHVVSQMGECIALSFAALFCNRFVTAGKRNRLEREERNFFRVIQSELDDVPDLLIIDAVEDRDDRNYVDARLPQILDRT